MAKFADILQAIRKEIVRLRVIDDIDRVILVARDSNVPNLVGDKDIVIRIRDGRFITSVEGQGRFYARIRRIVEVMPRTRTALDQVGRDEAWLLDQELGHLQFEEDVIDALELFQPTNIEETEFLVDEPMRWVNLADPKKPNEPNSKWGFEPLYLECIYKSVLDQSRQ